jgi:hypothetical protein
MSIIRDGNVTKRIIFVKTDLKGNKGIKLFGCVNEVCGEIFNRFI